VGKTLNRRVEREQHGGNVQLTEAAIYELSILRSSVKDGNHFTGSAALVYGRLHPLAAKKTTELMRRNRIFVV